MLRGHKSGFFNPAPILKRLTRRWDAVYPQLRGQQIRAMTTGFQSGRTEAFTQGHPGFPRCVLASAAVWPCLGPSR